MFKKILIANRGEIAVCVAKTARRMGIVTVGALIGLSSVARAAETILPGVLDLPLPERASIIPCTRIWSDFPPDTNAQKGVCIRLDEGRAFEDRLIAPLKASGWKNAGGYSVLLMFSRGCERLNVSAIEADGLSFDRDGPNIPVYVLISWAREESCKEEGGNGS